MKQTIKLSENELHNIIKESVMNILKEGFGDRVQGAIKGFKQGADDMHRQQSHIKTDDKNIRLSAEMAIKALEDCKRTGKTPNYDYIIDCIKIIYNNRYHRQEQGFE